MGSSTYFGSQVASIPHLERGDEVARDLRGDVDAAFVLLETALGGIVGGLTEGNMLIGNATNIPTALDISGNAQIVVGNGTTATSVAVTGPLAITNAGVTSFAQGATYGATQACYTAHAYIDATEDTLDIAGSPHPFRTAAGVSLTIPDNAIITNVRLDVVTVLASATNAATVSLGVETTTDVKGVTIITGAPFNAGGAVGQSLETLIVKTTGAQTLDLTVAAEDLTAGKIVALVDYFVTE